MTRNREHERSRNWWPTAKAMYLRNERVTDIAYKFKVTPSAVYMVISQDRKSMTYRPNIEEMTLLEAFFVFPDKNIKELAEAFKMTVDQVQTKLDERGITYRRIK